MAGEFLDGRLLVAAVLDRVEHPREHARRVGDRLLVADLGGLGVEDGDLGPLLVRRDLEGHARAGGSLAEDQCDDAILEPAYLATGLALRLELSSQADEPVELRVGEVELLEQVAAGEVHRTRLAGWPERAARDADQAETGMSGRMAASISGAAMRAPSPRRRGYSARSMRA